MSKTGFVDLFPLSSNTLRQYLSEARIDVAPACIFPPFNTGSRHFNTPVQKSKKETPLNDHGNPDVLL